jgi:Beta-glucosidase-related glycosidases
MKKFISFFLLVFLFLFSFGQYASNLPADEWVDSVFKTLNKDQKIAQLMVIRAHSNLGPDHVEKVEQLIQKYNVGGLTFFQGGPVRQANLTNYYQSIAKTPLLITIDGEWGLGMRLDSVIKFPYQSTLGAVTDSRIVYEMGLAVGEQCKRIGVQVNFAPVVDINNNPANPVIGYRSFGEDKYKVAELGISYMKGMQDAGIMACAKHFPGHGDVSVDSHFDLPVINKTMERLDSLELYPFKKLFEAGIGSVMVAHLYIPVIDSTENRATSLSKNNVTGLLKEKLGYDGLVFTDALEMKGVSKFFPGGKIAVESLIAGNDMLDLPEDVPAAIKAVKKSIKKHKLSWKEINARVKRVLMAKYQLGLNHQQVISTDNLVEDLNAKTDAIRTKISENAITLLRYDHAAFPFTKQEKIAYIGIGASEINDFGKRMTDDWNAATFLFSYKDDETKADSIIQQIANGNFDEVIIGVHNYSLRPVNNYSISENAVSLWNKLQVFNTSTFVFGNVYAVSNFCTGKNIIACYQDDSITQDIAADMVSGRVLAKGKLPVTVCDFKYGSGITMKYHPAVTFGNSAEKLQAIDSIANDAIAKKAFPGCVVLAIKDGNIIYHKAFGNYEFGPSPAVTLTSIYDVASVTKVSATTIAVMKLYEEGKLNLKKTLGDYLPWVRGTDKAKLVIEKVLLHQAGLVPFIPFYKETLDSTGAPLPAIYRSQPESGFEIRVAENLYMRNDWNDTIIQRILTSRLTAMDKYIYSDNDFIFLGKVVQAISGLPLDQYVKKNFYTPMGLKTTGFKPRNRFALSRLVPTEDEKHFRRQLLRGDVHDEGASLFGGVSGHAGLFSDAYDLGMIYEMLLKGGELNGVRYLKPETIKFFTAYHSNVSRRGLGFDKPEKDNATRRNPYPSASASPQTFGHTGFTGTCVWVDPESDLVYIFLSNRVNPTRDNPLLSRMDIRSNIQEVLYDVIKDQKAF